MFALWKSFAPEWLKHRLMVGWYNYLGRVETGGEVRFLNHGYDVEGARPELPADLEPHRYSIQLYHLLLGRADLEGKDLLEVSSGLGGGAEYAARCFPLHSATGLDIAARAVEACRARYRDPRLRFEAGSAEAMPFADESFDAVLNVESSLNYGDFDAFLREVGRVLRPGGALLFADYRRAHGFKSMVGKLRKLGWTRIYWEEIGDGVVKGMAHTHAAKRAAIERHVPRLLRATALRFARLDTAFDDEARAFSTGAKRYLAAILVKPVCRSPNLPIAGRKPAKPTSKVSA